jgi:hypothetical protein
MSMSGISSEVEAILPAPPPRKDGHPVVNANLNHFLVKDDSQETFLIDGREYLARDVGVENLLEFSSKNKMRTPFVCSCGVLQLLGRFCLGFLDGTTVSPTVLSVSQLCDQL